MSLIVNTEVFVIVKTLILKTVSNLLKFITKKDIVQLLKHV